MNKTGDRQNTVSYVQETAKDSEIKDRFGNTRFKVCLRKDGYRDNVDGFCQNYTVTVLACYCHGTEHRLVYQQFFAYDDAIQFFNNMVKSYSYLVQVETKDVQDIMIYADKTHYHMICPDCCATCKWARPCDKDNCLFDDWRRHLRGKFVCMNAALYGHVMDDIVPDRGQHDDCHDYHHDRKHIIDIRPVVDAFGLCKGFDRSEKFKNTKSDND